MVQGLSVRPKETVSMMTRDRVRLDADVYRPDAEGSFPMLLMRQPYGREIASTVVYAHPSWYAAQGFIVVIQDVRGRGTSEGEFRLFAHEVEDGYDTVEWAAKLPQSNGKVGMYGFSYQGMTQLFAAQARPSALVAIAPAMVGYHPRTDWAYENGALLLQAGTGWAIQLAAETARLRGDRAAFQALHRASRQLPLYDEIPARPAVLSHHAPASFFHDWIAHPEADDYWATLTPQLADVDLPMLHIGGWFDPYLRGDVRLYQEMAARSQFPQPLWIGPWGHIPWSRRVGDRDFGVAANSPMDRLQVDWFTACLQHTPDKFASAPVTLFEMGANRWRSFTQWPSGSQQIWCLTSSGLAAMDQRDGQLMPANSSGQSSVSSLDTWVHDPWRPVPSVGGHAAMPAGAFDRAAVDGRSDVLTYTSAPLENSLKVAGTIEVVLCCRCDRPSFDLSVILSEGLPDGRFWHLTQGYGRFTSRGTEWHSYPLTLQPTCFSLAAGHTLRLSISAACFPAYAVNAGTGAIAADSRTADAQIITLALQVGRASSTRLCLPIASDVEQS